jgi:hypothetical protein
MCFRGLTAQLPDDEGSRARRPGSADGYLVAITCGRIAGRHRAPLLDHGIPLAWTAGSR